MTETWDPEQYEKLRDYRRRPWAERVSRVGASSPEIVVDLGCGPRLSRSEAASEPAVNLFLLAGLG